MCQIKLPRFTYFPRLPPEIRQKIWGLVPNASRLIRIGIPPNLRELLSLFEYARQEGVDPEVDGLFNWEQIRITQKDLFPYLTKAETVSTWSTVTFWPSNAVNIEEEDELSLMLTRFITPTLTEKPHPWSAMHYPLLGTCRESRHAAMRQLLQVSHPRYDNRKFYMNPAKDILCLQSDDDVDQLSWIAKHSLEQLQRIEAVLMTSTIVTRTMQWPPADEDIHGMPTGNVHRFQRLGELKGLKRVIVVMERIHYDTNSSVPTDMTEAQYYDTARRFAKRDWWFFGQCNFQVEYRDWRGHLYGTLTSGFL